MDRRDRRSEARRRRDRLRRATAALALMTPGAFDDGEHDRRARAEVVASIVDAAARALLTTPRARRPEVAQRLAIGRERRVAGCHARRRSDGRAARTAASSSTTTASRRRRSRWSIAASVVGGSPITRGWRGRGRRRATSGRSSRAVAPARRAGTRRADDARVDDGFSLEGASRRDRRSGERSRRDRGRSARARSSGGQRTGRVYADVELVGDLAALLASVIGDAPQRRATIGIRDERDGLPRWRSIEAPWLRAKGTRARAPERRVIDRRRDLVRALERRDASPTGS